MSCYDPGVPLMSCDDGFALFGESPLKINDYHKHPAVSKSHLDFVAKSPLHYWARYLDPNRVIPPPTPAMLLGTAVHSSVLEPDDYAKSFVIAPADINRRTNAGKEEWAAFEAAAKDKVVLTGEQAELVAHMTAAVRSHPAAKAVLGLPGLAERSYAWMDTATDERCKCRPDWHSADKRIVVDLKTTDDASPEAFARSIQKWRYHVQASWYLRGVGGEQFLFLAVEKSPPFCVAVYAATPAMISAGDRVADRDLTLLAECRAKNSWPGYAEEIVTLDLPRWSND